MKTIVLTVALGLGYLIKGDVGGDVWVLSHLPWPLG